MFLWCWGLDWGLRGGLMLLGIGAELKPGFGLCSVSAFRLWSLGGAKDFTLEVRGLLGLG